MLGMRPYQVQLIGGIVLHQGRIAEMKTGEGKTLVATLPAYLNALAGEGVHIVTVNDYLAKRDSEWMGKVYRFLGLTVGLIVHGLDQGRAQGRLRGRHHLRHQQRDGLRLPAGQHGHLRPASWSSAATTFAIVDEVDSILIDEARTPLIISGQGEKSTAALQHGGPVRGPAEVPAHRRGRRQGGGGRRNPTPTTSWTRRPSTATLTARGHRQGGAVLPRGKPVRPGEHHPLPPHQPGHQAPGAL